jgi:hypothetical protein
MPGRCTYSLNHMGKIWCNILVKFESIEFHQGKAIIKEVKRDCEMAKKTRGLNLYTAGSINNGSLLGSMRAIMYAIQNYGRY